MTTSWKCPVLLAWSDWSGLVRVRLYLFRIPLSLTRPCARVVRGQQDASNRPGPAGPVGPMPDFVGQFEREHTRTTRSQTRTTRTTREAHAPIPALPCVAPIGAVLLEAHADEATHHAVLIGLRPAPAFDAQRLFEHLGNRHVV